MADLFNEWIGKDRLNTDFTLEDLGFFLSYQFMEDLTPGTNRGDDRTIKDDPERRSRTGMIYQCTIDGNNKFDYQNNIAWMMVTIDDGLLT